MTETIKTLREALEDYKQRVPGQWLADQALAALSRLEAEQPGSSTSEPTHPVCNCEACRLLRTEGVPTPCERLAAEYATPPVECPIRAVATEMIDALDNATEADEWSTSELRAAVASPCPPCQKCDSLRELLKEAVEVMKPFANWFQVMNVLLERDRQHGIERQGGWEDVDPVLGALGQIVTRGHFKRASELVARIEKEQKNA